jgi:hypothetical protein
MTMRVTGKRKIRGMAEKYFDLKLRGKYTHTRKREHINRNFHQSSMAASSSNPLVVWPHKLVAVVVKASSAVGTMLVEATANMPTWVTSPLPPCSKAASEKEDAGTTAKLDAAKAEFSRTGTEPSCSGIGDEDEDDIKPSSGASDMEARVGIIDGETEEMEAD